MYQYGKMQIEILKFQYRMDAPIKRNKGLVYLVYISSEGLTSIIHVDKAE